MKLQWFGAYPRKFITNIYRFYRSNEKKLTGIILLELLQVISNFNEQCWLCHVWYVREFLIRQLFSYILICSPFTLQLHCSFWISESYEFVRYRKIWKIYDLFILSLYSSKLFCSQPTYLNIRTSEYSFNLRANCSWNIIFLD